LAFLQGNPQEMDRVASLAANSPDDQVAVLSSQADTEAYAGHLQKARELTQRATRLAVSLGAKDDAANCAATAAIREAEFGNRNDARKYARAALALGSSPSLKVAAALALARTGEIAQARALADQLVRLAPANTLLIQYWVPTIRSAIALDRGDAAGALTELQLAKPYELGGDKPPFAPGASLYPIYLRGLAYAREKDWSKAQAEFEKIVANRGLVWNFPLAALAPLHVARAEASARNLNARATYQQFLSSWSTADQDIPVYSDAKRESAALN
jgi:eukaryotic-like serine/threonine-protein kinase